MNFENLPADWPTIPLTDPDHIADVLDIFVGERDRTFGALLILICDEQRRPVQPITIGDLDGKRPAEALPRLRNVAETVAAMNPDATILCAIGRRGRLRVTKTDRRWQRLCEEAFAGSLHLVGVHLITLDGTMPMPAVTDEEAA